MAVSKLQYGIGNGSSTTSSSGILSTDTALPLGATGSFQAAPVVGEGMVLINEGGTTEEIAYSTGLSGSSLTIPLANRGLEGGSAQTHNASETVKGVMTVGMWNNLVQSMTNVLLQSTGALDTTKVVDLTTAQILTNKDLTSGTNTFPSTAATTQTLTNKRITRRVGSTTSSATPTINTDNVDIYRLTAQTADITSFTTNLTGTPVEGDMLLIEVTGTAARAITWGSSFEASTVALPTTTVTTAMLQVLFKWNSATSKWRCLASV